MNEMYERLANAIILQAVKDYRKALKRLKKHPSKGTALHTKQEVEQFFRSDWYTSLTAVDPEMLILKLNVEVI
ncbi:MAG: hypothetical protein PHY15_00145 [Eubacteriales bacterium]|nr:hypothetical protein [Eubacteriales bacterium]MDD4475518.1 hypothetical protein [Eubacteriales bacterium]